jgi:hypothetical protein
MTAAPIYRRIQLDRGNVTVFGFVLAANGYASYSKGHGMYIQFFFGWVHIKIWLWMFNDGADYKDRK